VKQKLVLKQKEKQKQEKQELTETKLDLKARVAVHALQKQMQVLNLREAIVLASFILGAALLRIPMQAVPSAEPITFFAVLAGWLFGRYKGALVGATSLYISNFFMFGGQGPWTIFQLIGFGIAGYLGGFLRKKSSFVETLFVVFVATVLFEITMNLSSSVFFGFNPLLAFVTALPFSIIHIMSNSVFSLFIPKAKALIDEKAAFNEREIAKKLIEKIKLKR